MPFFSHAPRGDWDCLCVVFEGAQGFGSHRGKWRLRCRVSGLGPLRQLVTSSQTFQRYAGKGLQISPHIPGSNLTPRLNL